ncbi:MAG: hypothetical protein MEQ07_05440 [Aquimonas sp.]|nr:hypothetical protein [Aquimonas sp.]
MDKFDEMIGRAMSEEDRALLARYQEQGYVSEALGMFRGPKAAVVRLVYATVLVSFAGAAFAFWKLLGATDPTTAIQWGTGTVLLFQMTVLCKTYLGSHMEANRMLRELKRIELQVAMLQR